MELRFEAPESAPEDEEVVVVYPDGTWTAAAWVTTEGDWRQSSTGLRLAGGAPVAVIRLNQVLAQVMGRLPDGQVLSIEDLTS